MTISGAATHFRQTKDFALNANSTSTVSSVLDITNSEHITFSVSDDTGSHGNHTVTLQCSLDGTTFFNTESTLDGLGVVDNIPSASKFVRLKVTQSEGGTSTINTIIQAK